MCVCLKNLIKEKDEFTEVFKYLYENFYKELSKCDVISIIDQINFPLQLNIGKKVYIENREDIVCALLVLLLKSYNKNHMENIKKAFYDLYQLWQIDYTGRLWFEVDSLGLSEIRIPLNKYFPFRLFDLKHPNTTIIYEVDKDVEKGYDFEDVIRCRDDEPNSKVIIEFPKNYKFNNEINLIKFQWPNKSTIARFHTIKDKDGDDCLPFKLIYIGRSKRSFKYCIATYSVRRREKKLWY